MSSESNVLIDDDDGWMEKTKIDFNKPPLYLFQSRHHVLFIKKGGNSIQQYQILYIHNMVTDSRPKNISSSTNSRLLVKAQC